eukprot:PhF_6_TR18562/c0_g1_i1/m.27112
MDSDHEDQDEGTTFVPEGVPSSDTIGFQAIRFHGSKGIPLHPVTVSPCEVSGSREDMSRPKGWESYVAKFNPNDIGVGITLNKFDDPVVWYPCVTSALEVVPLPDEKLLKALLEDLDVVAVLQAPDTSDTTDPVTARRYGYTSSLTLVSSAPQDDIARARTALAIGTKWFGALVISSGDLLAENFTLAVKSYNADRDVVVGQRTLSSKASSSQKLAEVRCYHAQGKLGSKILIVIQDDSLVCVGTLSSTGDAISGVVTLGVRKGRFNLKLQLT